MLASVTAFAIGVFDVRPPPEASAPPPPSEPLMQPVVVSKPVPVEAPPPKDQPKRVRPQRIRRAEPAPPAHPPPARPFAAKLARVKAAPMDDLKFELADEVEKAADQTLARDAAAAVKACLTQFRLTGGVRHLEQCVEKFERASRSVMDP
jgi:hypothetical protein